MGIAVVLLLLASVVAVNYARYRDALYPGVVQPLAWAGVLCLYWLNQDLLFPLSGLAYAVIVCGTVTFSLGAHVGAGGRAAPRVPIPDVPFTPKPWYDRLLFWGPILGLIPYLYTAYLMGSEGPFDNFFMNLRFAATDPDAQTAGGAFGFAAYFLTLSYAAVLIHTLIGTYRHDRLRYGILVFTALLYAFFSSGRTQFMLLFVAVMGVLLLTRRIKPGKAATRGILVILGMFIGLGVVAGRVSSDFGSLAETVGGFYNVIVAYVIGSLPAFDLHIHTHSGLDWGQNTFRMVFAILEQLGAPIEVKPLMQEYVQVPFPTNVYTMYLPYYDDFGLVGVFLMPLFLGLLHGGLYRKATQGHAVCILLYALSLSPMIMQFFTEGYVTSLSLWIQYTLFFSLYFYRMEILPESLLKPRTTGPSHSNPAPA